MKRRRGRMRWKWWGGGRGSQLYKAKWLKQQVTGGFCTILHDRGQREGAREGGRLSKLWKIWSARTRKSNLGKEIKFFSPLIGFLGVSWMFHRIFVWNFKKYKTAYVVAFLLFIYFTFYELSMHLCIAHGVPAFSPPAFSDSDTPPWCNAKMQNMPIISGKSNSTISVG